MIAKLLFAEMQHSMSHPLSLEPMIHPCRPYAQYTPDTMHLQPPLLGIILVLVVAWIVGLIVHILAHFRVTATKVIFRVRVTPRH